MKKLLITLVTFLLPLMVSADAVLIDGIYYNLIAKAKMAEVTYGPRQYDEWGESFTGYYTGDVVIPESVTYEGVTYSVTTIYGGDYDWDFGNTGAFTNCTGLTSITIPTSITSIGAGAFSGCSKLSAVKISDLSAWCNISFDSNPLSYAHHLFLNGTEIKDLVIPNNVSSIGNNAFSGCSGLNSVTIGNKVTAIGNYAFSSCSGLTSVTIPNSVTSIGNSAFQNCSGLTSLVIGNSVSSIVGNTFSGCKNLTSVTIGNSVSSIAKDVFKDCSLLTSVIISDLKAWCKISFSNAYSNPLYHAHHLFLNGTEIRNLTIPNSITTIGSYAFYNCNAINSVVIPNGITTIGSYAFSGCNALISVTIPSSVTTIGNSAFNNCNGLTSVNISDLEAWFNIAFSFNPLTYAHHLYLNGTEIKELTIPSTVKSIGNNVFSGCSGLTSVTIPNTVTSIGSSAFKDCSGLTSVSFSDGLTSIGSSAFSGCDGLTLVTIPNTVTSIDSYAFKDCSGLTSVIFPDGLTSIGYSAFSGCSGLTSVSIPNKVKTISSYTFYGCSNLTAVTMGTGITEIYGMAFASCPELTDVFCYAENVPYAEVSYDDWGDYSIFSGSYIEYATLHVPDVSVNLYKQANPWKQFRQIVPITINTYTLTYMVDNEIYKSYDIDYGTPITPEPEPKKEGYIFSGWSQIPETMPAQNITVYGYFEVDYNTTNVLSCEDLESVIGSTPILKVNLKNGDEVKLCQFDLKLPAGVTVATKNNGKLDAKLTARAENHSISSQQLSNGDYRFIVSSLDNDSFMGNNGTLMEITLNISATIAAGEYTVKIQNVEVSVPDGNDLKVVRPADTESKLTVKAYTPGDVNNDGSVSVTDVGCAINYILEQVPSVFIFDAADMNGDKSVSVTDVGMIINLILNEGVSGSRRIEEENVNNDYHFSPNLSLQTTAEGYELQLEDKDAFIGFQFDVELDDGAIINGVQLNGTADSDHHLTYRRLDNRKWRVVCYSPTNSTFAADDTALLTISVVGNASERYFTGNAGTATLGSVAHFSDIRLTTAGLDELRPAALVSMSTGIANVEQDMKIGVQGKTLCITSDRDTTLRLLTIGGSVCRILHVHRGQNSFDGLRAGIYMIDNKKIIIR